MESTPHNFEQAYEQWFDFVWRTVRRLGAPPSAFDDAVQDVFMVIHQKLDGFEGRSSFKTWVFGITLRVVRRHQQKAQRHANSTSEESVFVLPGATPGPADELEKNQAVQLLRQLLGEMEERKRVVFIMSELEQMSVPEMAEVLSENVNTIYSRLRAAREDFELRVQRFQAQEDFRSGLRVEGGRR